MAGISLDRRRWISALADLGCLLCAVNPVQPKCLLSAVSLTQGWQWAVWGNGWDDRQMGVWLPPHASS